MAIIQCVNHHYYDDSKNSECPYCLKMQSGIDQNELGEQMTSYADIGMGEEQMTEAYENAVEEYDKTIGIYTDEETQNELTVGWLVCLTGITKGKSYNIHSGRNFAGSSIDMDLILSDDLQISESKHFSIVYDPKSITFYCISGNGQTYINGTALNSEEQLNEGDKIKVGESEYIFVPFCKKGRVWE